MLLISAPAENMVASALLANLHSSWTFTVPGQSLLIILTDHDSTMRSQTLPIIGHQGLLPVLDEPNKNFMKWVYRENFAVKFGRAR